MLLSEEKIPILASNSSASQTVFSTAAQASFQKNGNKKYIYTKIKSMFTNRHRCNDYRGTWKSCVIIFVTVNQ